MLDLSYSLVIEATEDPAFFGFFSPDLPGFSGIGHSMEEHVSVLQEEGLPVPSPNPNPTVLLQNDPRVLRSAAAD